MPSLFVHLGFAALLAAALLSDHFDWRALLVVFIVVSLPELDTFVGLWFDGAHRAMLHNVWIVIVPLGVLAWDVQFREYSFIRERWGARGVRVGWVSLLALGIAQLLLDAFYNGANLFWPVHDSFIDLSGEALYSTERGFVQTFVDFSEPESISRGTTNDTHYRTGVDPGGYQDREFYIAERGELFLLTIVGFLTAAIRLHGE